MNPIVVVRKKNGTPHKIYCQAWRRNIVDDVGDIITSNEFVSHNTPFIEQGTAIRMIDSPVGFIRWGHRSLFQFNQVHFPEARITDCWYSSGCPTVWYGIHSRHWARDPLFKTNEVNAANIYCISFDEPIAINVIDRWGHNNSFMVHYILTAWNQMEVNHSLPVRNDYTKTYSSVHKKRVTRYYDNKTLRIIVDPTTKIRRVDKTCQAYKHGIVNVYGIPFEWRYSARKYTDTIQSDYVSRRILSYVHSENYVKLSTVSRFWCTVVLDHHTLKHIYTMTKKRLVHYFAAQKQCAEDVIPPPNQETPYVTLRNVTETFLWKYPLSSSCMKIDNTIQNMHNVLEYLEMCRRYKIKKEIIKGIIFDLKRHMYGLPLLK